jgi:hypothetical protein
VRNAGGRNARKAARHKSASNKSMKWVVVLVDVDELEKEGGLEARGGIR